MEHLQEHEEEHLEEDNDLVEQVISSWIFFSPSAELTRLILLQNDKLGSGYFQQHYRSGNNPIPGYSENLLQSLQRVSDILLHRLEQKEPESQSEAEIISNFQAFFSERIFNHLAMLSRTPYARSGTFSIREELTIELAENIGLGLYLHEKTSSDLRDETERILVQLAWEFQNWFIHEHQGIFHTIWGSIFSVDKQDLRQGITDNSIIVVPDVEEPLTSSLEPWSALRDERSLA